MKLADVVIYFYDVINSPNLAGVPNAAIVYKRPRTSPNADLVAWDAVEDSQAQFIANVPHGQSLQDCLEVGNRWITIAEAEGFGIDLSDGDQDLTEL